MVRNLLQYPITADEVLNHVRALRDDEEEISEAYLQIGGTRLLCLNHLIDFLSENELQLKEFLDRN